MTTYHEILQNYLNVNQDDKPVKRFLFGKTNVTAVDTQITAHRKVYIDFLLAVLREGESIVNSNITVIIKKELITKLQQLLVQLEESAITGIVQIEKGISRKHATTKADWIDYYRKKYLEIFNAPEHFIIDAKLYRISNTLVRQILEYMKNMTVVSRKTESSPKSKKAKTQNAGKNVKK